MSARSYDFKIGNGKCWALAHEGARPSVTVFIRPPAEVLIPAIEVQLHITSAEARAMAVALEAAATHAENVLASGLGESAVEA